MFPHCAPPPTLVGVESPYLLILALAIGLIAGAVAMHAAVRGISRTQQPRPEPVIPEPATEVLSLLSSAYVVLDAAGDVLRASPLAYSYGIVRATGGDYPRLASRELMELVTQVSRHDGYRSEQVSLRRSNSADPAVVMHVRCGRLGSSKVLLLADDLTQLARVDETRRDFVANVSHELKTPVGAIGLLAETMQDAAEDPVAVRRFAQRMQSEAKRLTVLVQEIIELSRVQAAANLVDASEVEIDDVVAEAAALNATLAEAQGIGISVGGTTGLQVFGSASMLTSAVSNLIVNALTYSPSGTRIGISTRVDRGMVEISVKDDGIGISQENLERVFERFFRVDRARSRTTGGTGLGLAIVKHIASNHGGDVAAWSKEGSGSTFTLRIPALLAHDAYHGTSHPPSPHLSAGD